MVIMSDSASDDPTVTALLAMSEFFLSQRPPPVSEVARCLLAVLALNPVARVEASVRLRLGLLLSEHTSCSREARQQLEKTMLVAGSSGSLQELRFHAACSLASLLAGEGHTQQARGLLRGKLEATSHHPYWHIRLLFQLVDLHSSEGDVSGQLSVLTRCADYCQRVGAGHTHILATLARGAILLTHHNYTEAGSVLNEASSLLEGHRGSGLPLLRVFYLTIQVTHLLMAGQVKTAKSHLKQLQQCVQTLSTQSEESHTPLVTSDLSGVGRQSGDDFLWLTRHHAYITVYLVSVLHSVQAGLTDKALSYVSRALQLIQQENDSAPRPSGVLALLRAHVLEQSLQCLLMRGETATAASQLQDLVDVCHSHRSLIYSHRPVLHTLLGLYAFATGSLDRATAQFQTALQHTNSKELRLLISLNLAVCFMKVGGAKEAELAALMTSVNSDGAGITCQSLQSALSYVRGLYSFTSGRLHEAKRQLRETLAVANASDLNKLTSFSLLLLGQIFMALGNNKETLDMVTPALQLSVKMPENRLQIWAASLLADLYHTLGETERERSLRQQSSVVSRQLQQDLEKARENPAHQLLQWTIGEWPVTAPPPLPAEVRGQEKAPDVCHTPPRRKSLTMNGSPVVLKTPEILLRKVESPNQPLLLKAETTPTRLEAPPTGRGPEGGSQLERERLANHFSERVREESHHRPPAPSQHSPHSQGSPHHSRHIITPSHHHSESISPSWQTRPSPSLAHPHTQHSPHFVPLSHPHKSPKPHSSPPSHSPLTPHHLHHHTLTPSHAHHRQPPPSYEHSIQPHTPPHLPGASPSAPHSPQLHHLSPSHTPPPSRIPTHTPHLSHAHIDPAVEQHMLQTQQRLLWEQKYRQAQQRVVQSGPYLHSLVPHPPSLGHHAHHYIMPGGGVALAPPTHMTAHLGFSRDSNHLSHHLHTLPSSHLPPPSGAELHPLSRPPLHHHHGHR